jgi:hypothetical protein
MQRLATVLGFLVAVALLVAAAWMLYAVAIRIPTLNPTVLGAFITAAVGFAGLAYVQWQSKTRDIAESHRSSKLEVYNTFFDIAEQFQDPKSAPSLESGELPEDLRKKFIRLNRGLLIWASPDVIKAWKKFKRAAGTSANVLYAIDDVYQAIRKDLGNSNRGLLRGDLIRLQLKDPDELR